jgi:transposase
MSNANDAARAVRSSRSRTSHGRSLYLAALQHRHHATGKEVYLVIDNGPAYTSKVSLATLQERVAWLHIVWLARYSPELNPKEREWKRLKRDVRSHLAPTLRTLVDEIAAGLRYLGGTRIDGMDQVPAWLIAGHRKQPTGRPAGRRTGAKASYTRAPYRKEAPGDVAPWDGLRWANGRIALPGWPRRTEWRWTCAPHLP